ncbi:MAG: hypothetical protein H6679_01510 [Epsilonproteobacteria bacterium]|nr:hypothetical protein [Campylobacterota bacterium]
MQIKNKSLLVISLILLLSFNTATTMERITLKQISEREEKQKEDTQIDIQLGNDIILQLPYDRPIDLIEKLRSENFTANCLTHDNLKRLTQTYPRYVCSSLARRLSLTHYEQLLSVYMQQNKHTMVAKDIHSYKYDPKNQFFIKADEKIAQIYDLHGKKMGEFTLKENCYYVYWSPCSKFIINSSFGGRTSLHDATGKLLVEFNEKYSEAKISPCGKFLVIECHERDTHGNCIIKLWDLEKKRLVQEVPFFKYALSNCGRFLVTKTLNNRYGEATLKTINIDTTQTIAEKNISDHKYKDSEISLSPDGKYILFTPCGLGSWPDYYVVDVFDTQSLNSYNICVSDTFDKVQTEFSPCSRYVMVEINGRTVTTKHNGDREIVYAGPKIIIFNLETMKAEEVIKCESDEIQHTEINKTLQIRNKWKIFKWLCAKNKINYHNLEHFFHKKKNYLDFKQLSLEDLGKTTLDLYDDFVVASDTYEDKEGLSVVYIWNKSRYDKIDRIFLDCSAIKPKASTCGKTLLTKDNNRYNIKKLTRFSSSESYQKKLEFNTEKYGRPSISPCGNLIIASPKGHSQDPSSILELYHPDNDKPFAVIPEDACSLEFSPCGGFFSIQRWNDRDDFNCVVNYPTPKYFEELGLEGVANLFKKEEPEPIQVESEFGQHTQEEQTNQTSLLDDLEQGLQKFLSLFP